MAGTTARLALPYPDLPEAADVPKDIKALAEKVDAVVAPALVVPIGAVMLWAVAAAPTNWLICDGTAVPGTYPLLQAIMANTPDLRGRVPVGPDGTAARLDANDALGNGGGAQKHTLASGESGMPLHAHSDTFAVSNNNIGQTSGYNVPVSNTSWVSAYGGAGGAIGYAYSGPTALISHHSGIHAHALSGGVANAGPSNAASAHNNMQPYLVMNYIIRAA